jgi:uncharacterized protein YfaS (alpha-2-macroglobulin family)
MANIISNKKAPTKWSRLTPQQKQAHMLNTKKRLANMTPEQREHARDVSRKWQAKRLANMTPEQHQRFKEDRVRWSKNWRDNLTPAKREHWKQRAKARNAAWRAKLLDQPEHIRKAALKQFADNARQWRRRNRISNRKYMREYMKQYRIDNIERLRANEALYGARRRHARRQQQHQ